MKPVDAIVLAGGSPDDPLARRFEVPSKALIPVQGRPLVEHVLEALRGAGLSSIYVGPQASLQPPPREELPDQGSLLSNLELALGRIQDHRVVVATGDMPFLTPEAVRYVLDHAPHEAAFVYTAIPKEAVEARFPGMRRTYARLREGRLTGGNLVLLEPSLFLKALPLIRRAIDLRKSPIGLARMIGWGILLRFVLGSLSIPQLEARAQAILGVPVRALIVPFPEIGVDLDEEEDLRWVTS